MKIFDYQGMCNISGRRVREERERKRMAQDQLAAKMQVEGVQLNQKAISRIETGKRVVTDYELMILADVLGVTMEWLIGRD